MLLRGFRYDTGTSIETQVQSLPASDPYHNNPTVTRMYTIVHTLHMLTDWLHPSPLLTVTQMVLV